MKFFHRLSLFILTILFLFLTFVIAIYAFGWLPRVYLPLLLESTYQNLQIGLVSLVLFLLGSWLLQSFISTSNQSVQTIVQENEMGEVRISISALKDLIEQLVLDQPGIKNVKTKFDIKKQIFNIYLKLTVTTNANIPTLSKELGEMVSEYLLKVVGLKVDNVMVMVDKIETLRKSSGSTIRVR
ncbi:hypothetical protein BBF96_09160 [Anoxybacter fermentans]|uniref:Alkaline shock response membrane anchor protein AmaP n=1 Tax=Anoxybacter fermentans TaxID=1323375 RepID=A0A3S9SZ11_9FIRM|nr:alkaline shock response membrane anchor protein AmaP [Anoxybacter fermentans]AZR73539.1 hypothetical protein BBF96_09160 [Anoxybacter fermentans]